MASSDDESIDLAVGRIVWASSGTGGEDAKRIARMGIMWLEKILAKNADYGSSAWKVPVLAPECDPGVAIRVRMSDKIARLQRLLGSDVDAEVDESIEDTLDDLAGYCLLLRAMPVITSTQSEGEGNADGC